MDIFKIWIDEHQLDLSEGDLTEDSISCSQSGDYEKESSLPKIIEAHPSKKRLLIAYRGQIYRVEIQDKYEQLIDQMGYTESQGSRPEHVRAPMPGLVLEISVQAGDAVKQGESLIILEAMKMENVLKAHHDGVVRMVNVEKGEAVDKGQVLIEIE